MFRVLQCKITKVIQRLMMIGEQLFAMRPSYTTNGMSTADRKMKKVTYSVSILAADIYLLASRC